MEPSEQKTEHNIEQQQTGQGVEQSAGHYVQWDGEEVGQELEIEQEVGQGMEQRADLEQDEEAVWDKDLDGELQEAEELDQDGMTYKNL